ncbi:MAG: tRNA (adenosine(37)-N6)-threonylcarbamoyltransferase complex dimerization subunit type 1 TsaB [Candidatus Brocadiaceae bacterium]
MKVLGIETSGNIGEVAICKDRHVVITKDFGAGMQHSKELIPAIKDIFTQASWAFRDIDLIAVDVGPGSYTGLRIGVACAKTLAYALNKPVIDVPLFDIIAESYPLDTTPICPVLNARRNCVYACIYTCENAQRKRLSEFMMIQPEKLLTILPRPVVVFGDGISPHITIFQQKDIFIDAEEKATPKAKYVALLGERRYESGQRCDRDKLLPFYLRPIS